ncbi:MAG: chromosomal replication initiation protein DnaA [Nitrospirae bacterium GWC2_57_13]|nr:MAG: chromosomal replication initiation protein DnaA [Nitrospirae bacterium GWC2_57_13]OGW43174.1 MAG: chromosomal replication initiation protein DnaA [Nitrospirae bacterium GWD2_57_8]HAS54645.1 chromosomal replication initiator protein DnaA [Nitrospiraceae bacterium]
MDTVRVWEEILLLIENRVSKQGYDTWFSHSHLRSFEGTTMVIEVPNKFHRDWIREHYWDSLTEIIREVTKKDDMEIEFFVQPQEKKQAKAAKEDKKEVRDQKPTHLEKKYTFSNFVVGPSNQFAHAAAKAVADSPGRTYNPLFIYSGVGLGKTHLLHAIGHHVQSRSPRLKVTYLSSEQFTNELINRMSHQRMEEFRQKYRHMDMLLIDDIQFIAGKERTQEEFFHTFNALYDGQKQIVVTSDRQPKEIPDIEERLRSRFESGLISDIQPPDLETRIAILKTKADFWGIRLPDEVANFLASLMKNNIRELEGGLVKLGAVSSLTNTEISQEMAQNELKYLIDGRERVITNELIQKVVAESFGVKISDLKSKRRTRTVVLPRQVAMHLCRTLAGTSLPEIGSLFGGKDHSTVIHSCKVIELRKEKDPELRSRIETLTKLLKG